MSNANQNHPITEQQWQYINSMYNLARGVGIDLLKSFLPVVIVFVGLPAVFYEKMSTLFAGSNVMLLFLSWSGIIISVCLGFIAYFYIFEGYFNFAHSENSRMINDKTKISNFHKVSNRYFDRARSFGISCLIVFVVSLVFLVFFIASALFKKAC
jgi:hypothetical protein